MKETDMEQLIRRADFAAGSDHKRKLHGEIFPGGQPLAESEALSDDELDYAAAGVHPSRRMPERAKKGMIPPDGLQ